MTKKKIDLQPTPTEPGSTQPELTELESTELKLEAAPKIETEAAVEATPVTAIEAAEEKELQAEDELEAEGVETESEAEEENEAENEVEAEDGPEPEPEVEAEDGSQPESEPESESESEPESEDTSESEADSEVASEAEEAEEDESEPGANSKPRPPAKLERLQKILAAAGVASRRSAEAMIEQGRVQVNGKVVTELGTKADAGRDHIRVDGKLLQGAERLRYFVLNKPKGFVTTVKDPEGRPTVMQFFDKMKERLYPVGRLDYMSEGLLVVTNDGDLANRLTKASSGVEKTYLVKVAGQPTEAELDILRGGVAIERGKPGSSRVRTSPARIRQVRQGDNPWYEVVLVEGRNRELRKMFEEIGHFVEKIRRVGYGPLVLDQEPGNLRELEPGELERLRLAAEGKLRTPKSKDLRRRNAADAGRLPTVLPKPSGRPRLPNQPFAATGTKAPGTKAGRFGDDRPKKAFGAERPSRGAGQFAKSGGKPFRPARLGEEGFRPAAGRTSAPNPVRSFSHEEGDRSPRTGAGDSAPFGSARPAGRSFDRVYDRPGGPPAARSSARPEGRPAWKKDEERPTRPTERFAAGATGAGRPFKAKPTWKKPEGQERTGRPAFKSPAPPRRDARDFDEDLGPVRPPNLHIEEIQAERPSQTRSSVPRFNAAGSGSSRPTSSRPASGRPSAPRSYSDRPRPSRSTPEAPDSEPRPGAAKPFRGEGGLPRPFTTSSGKPRAGGARPSSKPGRAAKPGAGRSYGASSRGPASGRSASSARSGSGPRTSGPRPPSSSSSPRPYTPRTEGASDYRPTKAKPYPSSTSRAERKAGPDWKTKPSFGGSGKPASGSRAGSKPGGHKPGGFSKSGYKAKSAGSGAKRSGPRPGGKRPGGASGGKKRG
jgi:23S rRNA pseudouridine2605 synthase